jgi:catechol 2,3-dioxygenase-like lactoylglutathione lyase family enzyme
MNLVSELDRLLTSFEKGALTRRQLLAALAATAVSRAVHAQPQLRVVSLNHVTLSVSDVEKSHKFYEKLFGMQVVSRQTNGINLGAGPDSFLGLYKLNSAPGINHFCLGAADFKVPEAVKTLRQHGLEARVRDRDGVPELYLRDPDGLTVQVQTRDYRG